MNEIYLGDCLELMKDVPDNSVDMILCDLPYGITASKWDSAIPFEPLWAQYRRIITDKGAIVLTSTQPFTTSLISSNRKMFKYCWVWIKTRPSNHVNAKLKPMNKHEDICIFSKGVTANGSKRNMNYFPQGLKRVDRTSYRQAPRFGNIQGARPSHKNTILQEYEGYPNTVLEFANPNNKNLHPSQKPVELFEYLICTYTDEGNLVLDNCIGSGTTAIACLNTNRNYIGMELEEKYFNIATKRIEEHKNTLSQSE